jgi:phosphohistidine phosphatase SixA
MRRKTLRYRVEGVIALAVLVSVQSLSADSLSDREFVRTLQHGGNVIVMRHAKSPHEAPTKENADPGNTRLERQLDATGRTTAAAMGNALRRLKIPLGIVLSSPTFRALETAGLAKLPAPKACAELGNTGHGMRAARGYESKWLKRQVMQWPTRTNTVIVTHSPNIKAAFPGLSEGLQSGEALILGNDGKGGIHLLRRIRIEEWPTLAGD